MMQLLIRRQNLPWALSIPGCSCLVCQEYPLVINDDTFYAVLSVHNPTYSLNFPFVVPISFISSGCLQGISSSGILAQQYNIQLYPLIFPVYLLDLYFLKDTLCLNSTRSLIFNYLYQVLITFLIHVYIYFTFQFLTFSEKMGLIYFIYVFSLPYLFILTQQGQHLQALILQTLEGFPMTFPYRLSLTANFVCCGCSHQEQKVFNPPFVFWQLF